jgi:hypothetical protein
MPSIKKKLHQTCVSCFAALPKYKHKYCNRDCRPKPVYKSVAKPRHLWKKKGPPKLLETRLCKHCNTAFQITPALKKRFCSRKCSGLHRVTPKLPIIRPDCVCFVCGRSASWPRRRFCSDKCAHKHERMSARPKVLKRQKEPLPKKHCRMCLLEFQPKHSSHSLCSKKCSLKKRRKAKRLRERGKPKPIHVRIKDRLSNRLRELLRRKGQQKKNAISSYMGCSPKEMVAHIEKQFSNGMTWENYGVFGWHLDHIIPCERFDLTNEDHCRVCFNWRNIRPLWGEDNCNRQEMLTLDEALGIDPQLIKMVEEIGVKLW